VFAGRDWLDSLRIPLAVSAVNDPPRLHLPTTPVRAVVGAPVRGPSLDDIIDDGDDDLAELSISVRGDSGATVWIEDGHIHVRGQRTGPATAELFVVDPAGDTAVGRLSIEVSAPTAAPRLLGAPVPQLAAGDTLRLAMADWIADDDTPLESLSVSLEVAGAVIAAHRDGDSLRVVSGASGTGHVLLTLSDEDGNQTSTAWVFEVSDVVAVDAPPAGDAPPSVLSQRFAHKVV
jgi:hypothetical protein